MEKKEIDPDIKKINANVLTYRITHSNQKEEDLSNSFIRGFFDTFNIKKAVKTVFELTPLKITNQFVDGLIIFVYLLIVFLSLGLVKLEPNLAVITLIIILIPIIIEIFVANSPSLKKYFSNEEKAQIFLSNFHSMTHNQIQENINTINFSATNIGIFLEKSYESKQKIPSYIIKQIISANELTIDHLDIIFSTQNLTIFNNDEDFVIFQLNRFTNKLTQENIKNVYSVFKSNDKVIKMLIATQYESNVLLNEKIADQKGIEYYDIYQNKQKQKDWYLRIISLNGINLFNHIASFVIICTSFLVIIMPLIGDNRIVFLCYIRSIHFISYS
jgi:hypothetical protein